MTRVFHLLSAQDARRLEEEGGPWRPASLTSEGFVHLSAAEQVAGTLQVHFTAVDEALLIEVDARSLGDALCWEPSRDGQDFPHLYRALEHSDLVRAWWLSKEARGWSVPALGGDPAQDAPQGGPPPSWGS